MAVNVNGGPLDFEAQIKTAQFQASINAMQKSLEGLTTTAQKQAVAVENIVKNATAAISAYGAFATASNFIGDIVKVRGEFQQLEVAFTTMLQSKDKADKLMKQAVDLAAHTPFTLQEVGTGAKQLLAYGFAADKVTDNLTTLGNIAAGVGAPLSDIVYLYGTLKTQGRAYTRDILQFTSRGIPIISELAKQFGVTEENVQKLVEGGKVGFPEVERAFNALTSSGGLFFNLMQEQSKTLTGLTSNLKDAWATMLNEIGKSNQGIFTDAIKGATVLVQNYKEVLKVLEVLVLTYGSYRAALIATNALTVIQTSLARGYTIAETLRYQAMLLSERAMKLLNATMLANPTTAVITGILALASALYVLKPATVSAVSASKLLEDSIKSNKAAYDEKKRSIEVYTEALKKGNLTENERISIYEKIKAIDPELVKGINKQSISYDALIKNVKAYLDALRDKLALEANAQGVSASIKKEQELQGQIDTTTKSIESLQALLKKNPGNSGLAVTLQANIANLQDYNAELKKQQATTKEIVEKGLPKPDPAAAKKTRIQTNKEIIDETQSLEVLAAFRKNLLEEYEKSNDATQRKVLAADLAYADKRKAALDVYGSAKQAAKDLAKEETGISSLLEKRKGLLEDIAALQRGSKQSGLIREQSEIDKVNEKYDIAIKKIEEYNKKAENFNKKNPSAKVSLVLPSDVEAVAKARLQEIQNTTLKVDADNFKKSLEIQQGYFVEFEDAKKDIGIEKASEMYAEQTKGFKSYTDFLQNEADKIISKVFAGPLNIGDQERLIAINKELVQAKDKQAKEDLANQQDNYKLYLEAAKTFDTERAAIEKKYSIYFSFLEKDRTRITAGEYEARLNQLKESKKEELSVVAQNELEKSDAFKRFEKGFNNVGITATRGILKGLQDLRDKFKAMGEDVSKLDKEIDTTKLALNQKSVSGIREAANLLRGAFKDMNIQVAGQLKITAAQISDALENVSTLLSKDSSKGQQVGSIIGLISFVIVGIRDALLTAKDLADPLQAQKDYYTEINNQISASNELLTRQKAILDDLVGLQKVDRSFKYLDDLKKQQDAALKSLQAFKVEVINSQREIFVDPVLHTKVKTSGLNALADIFLYGGQAKRKIEFDLGVVDTSSLSTIEDFANLLNEIKLNGGKIGGKVVLEENIKSLQLLVDTYTKLDQEQKQFALQLQQLITGTTQQSIEDSIVDGFKNGKRAASDFADTFRDLMQNAVFQALKFQALEGPLKDFYDQFAKFSASDDILSQDEIENLKNNFNDIIVGAAKKFDELQKITGLPFNQSGTGSQANSIVGGIKGITEDQANLLAGQFGGLRITAGQQLGVLTNQLNVLNSIQYNTSFLVANLPAINRILGSLELNGIKIKQ